jgi:serine/threonine protein kinase
MSLELRGERFHKLFTAGRNSFIQEARLLARFNHPGLLHVLRFWEENGTAYMGTLYYSGMTLKEWQITSPDSIDENWIRRLLPPLFGAIDTIHAAGYLHRDISLDNIQIQENQLPVLLDFGSARKEIGNLSDETEIMLKPGFAPIEQYSEEGEIEQGPWTDIYALGAVLHNLITGHAPPVSVVRCIEDNYQPLVERKPEGYSLPLLHAIDCALAMKPADRPQSIDAFASLIDLPVSDVEALSTTIPLVAEPVVPVEPSVATPEPQVLAVNHAAASVEPLTPRNVRRLSPGLVVAAAIAVLAVVVVVWKANHHSEAPPVAASTAPAAPAAAGNSVASSAPTVATVYLRLQAGENVMLNGEARDVKPSSSGFASLNLAAGNYRIEVRNGNQVHSQSLTIDKPGTWLINPAQ